MCSTLQTTHTLSLTHTVCPALSLDNGIVSHSVEMGVERNIGSVATHTCDSGFRLIPQGMGNTRTCSISGWSDPGFMCGEYFMSIFTTEIVC